MLLLTITLVMPVVYARSPSPFVNDFEHEEVDVRDKIAATLLNRVQFPNEFAIWSILAANWFPKIKTKDNSEFEFQDKKFLLKPSRDLLTVTFLVTYGTAPAVVRIKLNDRVIYNILRDVNKNPKLSAIYVKPGQEPDDDDFFRRFFSPRRRRLFRLNTHAFETGRCGTVKVQGMPLITYGTGTSEGEWPWHAALYRYRGMNMEYACGGSLISRNHLLTAAHCVTKHESNFKINEKHLQVYLGKHNLYRQDRHMQSRGVSKITVHPDYNSRYLANDIAILKLDRAAQITDFVRHVCLWEDDKSFDTISGRKGTIIGWGADETGHTSEYLMQAVMPVVSRETCVRNNLEYFTYFSSDNIFCAKPINGTSACTGDSGGGMVFAKTGPGNIRTWQLRGVISTRTNYYSPCNANQDIVFSDVTNYLNWIKLIIKKS